MAVERRRRRRRGGVSSYMIQVANGFPSINLCSRYMGRLYITLVSELSILMKSSGERERALAIHP